MPQDIKKSAPKRGVVPVGGQAAAVFRGICRTCNHAATCAHIIRTPDLVVWDCENFDGTAPVADRRRRSARVEEPQGEVKGLCINCAYRDTCLFPRPEGGVWHCAEYES